MYGRVYRLCMGVCIDMCMGVCVGLHAGMRCASVDLCTGMCVDMLYDSRPSAALRTIGTIAQIWSP